ncbi:GNAT family N-acetyltransferase [Ottowia thiooxydans]|uniref:N-acetylglutamate synthase-like GNAT family acetyltransferase n=1 Tax=Ottowia thiooxydans TaxID=219182 RepID=A0ABV2QDS4_9BURK
MQIRNAETADIQAIHSLLSACGWGHRLGDVNHLSRLISASQRAVVAEINNEIVGFVRGITDGLSNGYVSMVAVAELHRGQGIGRTLVEALIEPAHEITWVLRAGRVGAAEFFAKLGFTSSTIAMERPRTQVIN